MEARFIWAAAYNHRQGCETGERVSGRKGEIKSSIGRHGPELSEVICQARLLSASVTTVRFQKGRNSSARAGVESAEHMTAISANANKDVTVVIL